MLEQFKQLFATPEEQPQTDNSAERLKIATCVVLLEVAQIDEEFTDDERHQIVGILQKRYELSEEDAHELLDASTQSREQSVDLWHFTNQLNQQCTNEEKMLIVEEVWRVVFADNGIHGNESAFMRQLGSLLNLGPQHIIEAKVKILAEVRGETTP